MASSDALTPVPPQDEASSQPSSQDANPSQESSAPAPAETVFLLEVKLPHEPWRTQIQVSSQEQIQDVRQSITDQPVAMQYSCFHLEVDGKRINDFVDLSEVSEVSSESTLTLVEDPYTEKEARMHLIRVRDLVGAAGDRTDTIHGINAGLSLHDHITEVSGLTNGHSSNGASSRGPDFASYDFDAPGSIKSLLPPSMAPPPRIVKALGLSAWNPPPYQLRTKGHLLYLTVTTNEGEQYHITSHVSGFFVNKSTHNKFDPNPRSAPKNHQAHSLLTLLHMISPSFETSFQQLLEYNGKREPLTMFQLSSAIPASPWMVEPPAAQSEHQADIARTQESYLLAGVENAETLRDWNEEFQTTRELARDSVQDKVFRERLTQKLFADYNEAATRGAVLVARGEVPPLNPTEGRDAQIFVYNNVFFSFGADGVGTFSTDGGDEAARVATGKDVMGVKAVNQLDINGLFTPGTVVVDYLGKRIVGQSIVPGIFRQREPGEHQIDYGGVEGKDVVADNASFAPLFEQLSQQLHVKKHPVWDKDNKRHDLEGSVETKGLLGTDGRKYVLDLYRITPLDVAWLEQYWGETPEEREGVDRKDYPHRMAVLRAELIESYTRMKLREYVEAELSKKDPDSPEETVDQARTTATDHASTESPNNGVVESGANIEGDGPINSSPKASAEPTRVDVSGFKFALNPDVFSGQAPQTEEEKEQYAADEAEVRAICNYLVTTAIPQLFTDLQDGDIGFPMDGKSLTTTLHKRGINLRYLGVIAKKAAEAESPRIQALYRLTVQEMVIRGFKHVANEYLRHLPTVFAPACVAHMLNCLLGWRYNDNPSADIDEVMKALYPEAKFDFERATPETLKQSVAEEIRRRFRYELQGDLVTPGKEVQVLREVCLKLGLQVAAKDYRFTADKPWHNGGEPDSLPDQTQAINGISNGHGKKKKKSKSENDSSRSASPISIREAHTFHNDDILNFVPIVKEASPRSVLPEEAYDGGRMSLAQDQKQLGQELLLESLSLYEQIYGILHPDVARIYLQLSSLYYSLDEKGAAVELARKAVIVAERTLGVDSSETILSYLNLGLFEHSAGNSKLALAYVLHALELWKVVYGPHHPDSITTINNAAVMLQSMKRYHESRLWFEACLKISEEVSGKHSVNTATLLFQLAQGLALDHDSHAAVNRMRESCNIFRNTLGPDDRNTKEAEQWLDQLTQSAVNLAKRAKDLQSGRLKRVHFTTRVPGAAIQTRPQPPVGGSMQTRSNVEYQIDQRNIDELIRYIDGTDKKKKTGQKKKSNPKRRGQMGLA